MVTVSVACGLEDYTETGNRNGKHTLCRPVFWQEGVRGRIGNTWCSVASLLYGSMILSGEQALMVKQRAGSPDLVLLGDGAHLTDGVHCTAGCGSNCAHHVEGQQACMCTHSLHQADHAHTHCDHKRSKHSPAVVPVGHCMAHPSPSKFFQALQSGIHEGSMPCAPIVASIGSGTVVNNYCIRLNLAWDAVIDGQRSPAICNVTQGRNGALCRHAGI